MLFFVDEQIDETITYVDLLKLLSEKDSVKKYIVNNNNITFLIDLTFAMIHGLEVYILDGKFSKLELEHLGITNSELESEYSVPKKFFNDICEIYDNIYENMKSTKLYIYSSGTTGKPKVFSHSLNSLMRNIKINSKHGSDIWGLGYNLSHFAGIQVFLQAFLNKNTIVNLFGTNSNNANNLLKKYNCNCLSATATFYRNFILISNEVNFNVKNITFGGEIVNSTLIEKINKKFPNAKIRNIYASTEAGSLLSGVGELFKIPDNLSQLIKISENNHLLLHSSLLENKSITNEWYDTNDIVMKKENGWFKFLKRKTDFINIGGYKVNPNEVEEIILKHDNVVDVAVYGRDNSVMGNILVADIKVNEHYNENVLRKEIIQLVRKFLQDYKVPRVINFVKNIQYNRTGKKVR